MKSETLGFVSVVVFIFALVFVGFVVVNPALAQVGTSTDLVMEETIPAGPSSPTTTESTTQEPTPPASEQVASSTEPTPSTTIESAVTESTPPAEDQPAASPAPEQTEAPSAPKPTEARPAGLTEVRIIGTKYIDYFTDGTNTYSFPGDPKIHAHIAEKDAPIPTHEGMTWVHSTGQYLYDTASGDLEVGQYALQPSGTYIEKRPAFVSATSSPSSTEPITAVPVAGEVAVGEQASATSSPAQ